MKSLIGPKLCGCPAAQASFYGRRPLAFSAAMVALSGSVFVLCFGGCPREEPTNREFCSVWGPRYPRLRSSEQPPCRHDAPTAPDVTASIRYWNDQMLAANALDHTPVVPDEIRIYGEQLGPCRTSRAFAIVQIAVFQALNAASGAPFENYSDLPPTTDTVLADAAVGQAAHDTLAALWPSQAANFDTLLADDLARLPDGPEKSAGVAVGALSAAAILALRADDGSDYPQPVIGVDYFTGDQPGDWRQDPVSEIPIALDAYWGAVTPFVLKSSKQYPVSPPPPLDSAEYAAAFDEVKRLGGDGIGTPTERTAEQTTAGIYWGYDGTPGLGTPPRLYNQIALQIASQMQLDALELARLLALVNVAMADAAISCWEYKYDYSVWRPITGIREADPGTGPTGQGDGNPATVGDPDWTPLGAPASNLTGPNFTPPFPSYTSGHATFGGALFQTLRRYFGTDDIAFTFVSDEYNGITEDNEGNVRPLIPRTFATLSEAEEENGQSRIYLGIHWAFDKTAGIAEGRRVADYVYENAFKLDLPPLPDNQQ